MSASFKLYIKPGCPWCIMAEDWLQGHGYRYEVIDVRADRKAFEEMIRISGQHRAPTLVVGDRILPDFGPEELAAFLKKYSIMPV
jgi:monothiol glutaredoxin